MRECGGQSGDGRQDATTHGPPSSIAVGRDPGAVGVRLARGADVGEAHRPGRGVAVGEEMPEPLVAAVRPSPRPEGLELGLDALRERRKK